MSIIGAIAGLGQGLLQRKTDELNANRNFQQNMEMSKYQYSKDLEMWNRANEYNSPAMQMQRYMSAGLNPNLIYGTGTASAGNTATSLPKYQAPTYQQNYSPVLNLPAILSEFQNFNIRQAQTDNLRTQGDILYNQNVTERAKAVWNDQEMRQMFFELKTENGVNTWRLKPNMQDTFREILVGKWTKPVVSNQLMSSQQLRNITDNAIKEIQLKWMKKLGVSGLGQAVGAMANVARFWMK